MDENDKKSLRSGDRGSKGSRAKNQTVMLTPEIAGQVRALLNREEGSADDMGGIGGGDRQSQGEGIFVTDSHGRGMEPRSGDTGVFTNLSVRGRETEESDDQYLSQSDNYEEVYESTEGHDGFDSFEETQGGGVEGYQAPEQEEHFYRPQESEDSREFGLQGGGSYAGQVSGQGDVKESSRTDGVFETHTYEQAPEAASSFNPPVRSSERSGFPTSGFHVSGQHTKSQNEENTMTNASIKLVCRGELSKLVGFLVSYDKVASGEYVELRSGRWMLTSRPMNEGNYFLVEDPSISPLHAILRISEEGVVQVLDQLSEYGTGIQRGGEDEEEEVVGQVIVVAHGDRVRFGKRNFFVCVLPEV